MNAGFFKRLGAYIIDIIIIDIIVSLITLNLNINKEYTNNLTEATNRYTSGEISYIEFTDAYVENTYYMQKNNVIANICQLVMVFGYFVVFQTLNKGQTIGKKILKIRIVNEDDSSSPKFSQLLSRGIFNHNFLSLIMNAFVVKYLTMKAYTNAISVITSIETIFLIVIIFFIIYSKDKRGLHDIITHTKVISE